MHRDRRLVVEGHPSLPVGMVLVPLRVQDWCRFGLVCSAEGLFKKPQEVWAFGVRPGHDLQCGSLGGVVGDRGLVEDVDAGGGFCRRQLLGTGSCGAEPCPARAPSGVEEVDDALSCGRLPFPLLGLGLGPCVVDLARVLGAGEVPHVGDAQLRWDHLTTVSVSPEFDGAPHLLVVGGGWVPLDVDCEPLVVPRDAVPLLDLRRGPYPRGGARGRGVFEGHLHWGTYGVLRVQGGGFLFGPTFRPGFQLGCGFGLCGGLALLRTLAVPGSGPYLLERRALGLLCRRVARCKHGVVTGGWDVGLGLGDGVLQLEHLLGHDAKRLLGRLRASGGSVGQVRSGCPVLAPWRRMWAVSRVAWRVHGGMRSGEKGAPLVPRAPSRGRSAVLLRLPLGCGGRGWHVASGLRRVAGAGPRRRGRVPLPV